MKKKKKKKKNYKFILKILLKILYIYLFYNYLFSHTKILMEDGTDNNNSNIYIYNIEFNH